MRHFNISPVCNWEMESRVWRARPLHRYALLLVCVCMMCLAGGAVLAQDMIPPREVSDDEVNAIAEKLYCPVCENITLDACGTSACADWRYEIRLQLESGLTEQQIVEDFVRRFGDRVVGTPLDPALRTMSLVTPWAIIALALVGAAYVFTRRRPARPAVQSTSAEAPASPYHQMFEQDLSES